MTDKFSNTDESSALKIISKQRLHPEQVNVIRGESKILQSLVGLPNLVQFLNIFESEKFIVIHMEHLRGPNMKRDIKQRLMVAMQNQDSTDNESQSEGQS